MTIINSGIRDLWQIIITVSSDSDVSEQRRKVFELSRLLFEAALPRANLLGSINKDDLTDLLLECQLLGNTALAFFTDALPHIDPEYKGKTLEEELQGLKDRLGEIVSEIERIRSQRQQLLAAENNLRDQQEKLLSLKTRISELEEIEVQVQPEQLSEQLKQAGDKESELIQHVAHALTALINRLQSSTSAKHLKANHKILETLRQSGQVIPEKLITTMERVQKDLEKSDGELKAIIEQRDQLFRQISAG